MRQVDFSDYNKGFLDLINYFTRHKQPISREKFEHWLICIYNQNAHIYVIEEDNQIIATAKLLLEYKLHNNLSIIGHIEDVIVSEHHRGRGLGRQLVEHLLSISKKSAYKTVLNCSTDNISFYEKCGFVVKGAEMTVYHLNE